MSIDQIILEQLEGYFSYGLRWYKEGFPIAVMTDINSKTNYNIKSLKPLFHPLSDLINPIKVEGYNDGKEFIPIIELAKLFNKIRTYSHYFDIKHLRYYYNGGAKTLLTVEYNNNFLFQLDLKNFETNPFYICKMMKRWHFWVYDQSYFEKGLIIDINTLNNE